jgi:two-component system, cell cycle sensor histidine kinase and response regulator CckA
MAHEGLIDVSSQPGQGATFDIFFPAATVPAADETATAIPPAMGQERILVVEDEEMVASLIRTILESRGYHVVLTHDPLTAVDICRTTSPTFDLAIVGYTLPHMRGDRCLVALQTMQPKLKGILMTGSDVAEDDLETLDCQVLYKPFSMTAIARMVRDVLDADNARTGEEDREDDTDTP